MSHVFTNHALVSPLSIAIGRFRPSCLTWSRLSKKTFTQRSTHGPPVFFMEKRKNGVSFPCNTIFHLSQGDTKPSPSPRRFYKTTPFVVAFWTLSMSFCTYLMRKTNWIGTQQAMPMGDLRMEPKLMHPQPEPHVTRRG